MDINKEYLKTEYLIKRRSISDIAKEFNISSKLMYYYIKKFGLNVKGVKTNSYCDESKFTFEDPIFCYYAGLILTDGYLDTKNNRVSLRVNNEGSKEVLELLRKHFNSSSEIKVYKGNNDITIHSKVLLEVLKEFDIKDKKDCRTFDIDKIMDMKSLNLEMFMRGVLDGDGNIHVLKSKYTDNYVAGQFRIAMKSEYIIKNIIEIINNVFGTSYEVTYMKGKNNTLYPQLYMNKMDSINFYRWVYRRNLDYKFLDKYKKYLLIG